MNIEKNSKVYYLILILSFFSNDVKLKFDYQTYQTEKKTIDVLPIKDTEITNNCNNNANVNTDILGNKDSLYFLLFN